jgi:hypothetical protein
MNATAAVVFEAAVAQHSLPVALEAHPTRHIISEHAVPENWVTARGGQQAAMAHVPNELDVRKRGLRIEYGALGLYDDAVAVAGDAAGLQLKIRNPRRSCIRIR